MQLVEIVCKMGLNLFVMINVFCLKLLLLKNTLELLIRTLKQSGCVLMDSIIWKRVFVNIILNM